MLIAISIAWCGLGVLLQFWGGRLIALPIAALLTIGMNAGYNLYKAMYSPSYNGPTPKWGELGGDSRQTILIIGVLGLGAILAGGLLGPKR